MSDNGSQCTSKSWKSFVDDENIRHIFISVYHPSSSPAERYMQEIGRLCRTYCHQSHTFWIDHLRNIEYILNSLQHSSAGFCPYEVIHQKKPAYLIYGLIEFPVCRSVSPQEREEIVMKTMEEQANI